MAEQLTYDGRVTVPISAAMPREDDRYYEFDHLLGPASAIKEAHFRIIDSNDVVILALSMEEHPDQFDFSEDNKGKIWIKHANTSGMSFDTSYRCGVELIDQLDLHYTAATGSFLLQHDIVNDGGTAPYLTWTTRSELETAIEAVENTIEGIKTCNTLTTLSASASATDTSITVSNGSVCPATSVIRIFLDDDSYDERTVNTQVGDLITFTTGLTYAAQVGNIVRRVS